MKYRSHKGIDVSEIGVGCYSLTGVYGKKDVEQFKKMLNRAHELGVTFHDTAEGYGDAERILGETVRLYRDDIVIATKVGVKEGLNPQLSSEYIRSACNDSLERLNTGYIDLYQVHFDDPLTPVKETVHALEDLVSEGKIRFYGVGHLPVERVEQYCTIGNVWSILMELSAVSRHSRKRLLPLCQKSTCKGIAFSTTGRGLLTGKIRKPAFDPTDIRSIDALFQRENFDSGLRIVEKFTELGAHYGKSCVQVALSWVLSQPGIICALTGPSTIPHLEENCGGSGWTLSSEHLQELEELFTKEDEWLKKERFSSIQKILSQKLPQDFSEAFKDFVYVLETSMLLEIVEEKEILPVFYELFPLQKTQDRRALEGIQKNLHNILSCNL